MLLAYIENGNTTFYNVPEEYLESISNKIDFINKYDLERYRIGEVFYSKHTQTIVSLMPIDICIITVNKFKKLLIQKDTALEFYKRLQENLINEEEDNENKRLIGYEKGKKVLLFYCDNNTSKDDIYEYYRKYYVGSLLNNPYTRELLSSMQVKLMANEEKTEKTIKM